MHHGSNAGGDVLPWYQLLLNAVELHKTHLHQKIRTLRKAQCLQLIKLLHIMQTPYNTRLHPYIPHSTPPRYRISPQRSLSGGSPLGYAVPLQAAFPHPCSQLSVLPNLEPHSSSSASISAYQSLSSGSRSGES